MIQEIFITSPANKVLFGDVALYPDSPSYPMHVMAESRLCQLRVNDVVLSILYKNMDGFTAAKYLHDLRRHIEDRLVELNEKNVYNHYFAILELLQGVDTAYEEEAASPLSLIPSDSTYIDVVESIHAVVLGDGTVLENNIYGHILISKLYAGRLRMVVDKGSRYRITSKSNYETVDDMNRIEVVGRDIPNTSALLGYSASRSRAVIFSMKRVDNKYTFICAGKLKFKFVQFVIPVPKTTFEARLQTSRGSAEFDMEESHVVWDFAEGAFAEESISIEKHVLEEYVDTRPIRVHFTIPEWTETGLRVEGCSSEDSPADKFWVTYTTQDGCYEIRE